MEEYLILRGGSRPEESDMHRAFNLAFKVMTMVSCTGENQPTDLFDTGSEPAEWRNGDSLSKFLESTFPIRDHPTLNEKDEAEVDIKSQLRAVHLQKMAGLKFCGTDSLRDHLRMNQETGTVELYHHTSVLKEILSMEGPDCIHSAPSGTASRLVSFSTCCNILEQCCQPQVSHLN